MRLAVPGSHGIAPEHKDVGAASPCSLRDPYLAVVIYKEKTERGLTRDMIYTSLSLAWWWLQSDSN